MPVKKPERAMMLSTESQMMIVVDQNAPSTQCAVVQMDKSCTTENASTRMLVLVIAFQRERALAKPLVILTTQCSTAILTISRVLANTALLNHPATKNLEICQHLLLTLIKDDVDLTVTLFPVFME